MTSRSFPSIPGEENAAMQVQQGIERYRADAMYFERNREDLVQRYPDRWIAIYGEQVVGTAKRLPVLVKQLERRGFPRGRVFIERASTKDDLLILAVARSGAT